MVYNNLNKTEIKICKLAKELGASLTSAGMLADITGYKVAYVKSICERLVKRGVMVTEMCTFHKNTKVYALTSQGEFDLTMNTIGT